MTLYHFNPKSIKTLLFDTVFLLLFNWFGVSTCIWTEAGSRSRWPEEFQHIQASAKVHHPLETVKPQGLAPTGEIIVHLLSYTSQNQTKMVVIVVMIVVKEKNLLAVTFDPWTYAWIVRSTGSTDDIVEELGAAKRWTLKCDRNACSI